MPSDDFHVHGVHDHAIEHAAEHAGGHGAAAGSRDSLPGRIAVLSAILATLGAIMAFAGGDTQANAQLYKNSASITKTRPTTSGTTTRPRASSATSPRWAP